MTRQARNSWVVLAPPLPERSGVRDLFREHARTLAALLERDADDAEIDGALEELRNAVPQDDQTLNWQ